MRKICGKTTGKLGVKFGGGQRIMRAGDNPSTQHHPTAMGMMIETFALKIYWFLMGGAGAICESLHRHCTVVQGKRVSKAS